MILVVMMNCGAHLTEYSISQNSNNARDGIYDDILNKKYISLSIKLPG